MFVPFSSEVLTDAQLRIQNTLVLRCKQCIGAIPSGFHYLEWTTRGRTTVKCDRQHNWIHNSKSWINKLGWIEDKDALRLIIKTLIALILCFRLFYIYWNSLSCTQHMLVFVSYTYTHRFYSLQFRFFIL